VRGLLLTTSYIDSQLVLLPIRSMCCSMYYARVVATAFLCPWQPVSFTHALTACLLLVPHPPLPLSCLLQPLCCCTTFLPS
jgi:hypothetical protein